jgi:hypothetical protein
VPTRGYRLCAYPAGEQNAAAFAADVKPGGNTVYSAFVAGYVLPEDAPTDKPFEIVPTSMQRVDDHIEEGDN